MKNPITVPRLDPDQVTPELLEQKQAPYEAAVDRLLNMMPGRYRACIVSQVRYDPPAVAAKRLGCLAKTLGLLAPKEDDGSFEVDLSAALSVSGGTTTTRHLNRYMGVTIGDLMNQAGAVAEKAKQKPNQKYTPEEVDAELFQIWQDINSIVGRAGLESNKVGPGETSHVRKKIRKFAMKLGLEPEEI